MGDRGGGFNPNFGESHGESNRFHQSEAGGVGDDGRGNIKHVPHPVSMADAPPFFSQVPNPSSQASSAEHQPSFSPRHATITYGQGYPSPFNLGHMAGALPGQMQNATSNQWMPISSQPSMRPHIGATARRMSDHGYAAPQQQGYYPEYGTNHPRQMNPNYMSPQYMQYQGQYMQDQPFFGFMPAHPQSYSFQSQPHAYAAPGHPYLTQGQSQPFIFNNSGITTHLRPGQLGYPVGMSGISSRSTTTDVAGTAGSRPDISVQTIPRGPPRKPRQSGHALWVGNLPSGATVIDLKDHFSREATNDIESLKLISKSNCAFVNYRTHVACAAAMERFHDSRFQGTKLVCRLRRTTPVSPVSPSQADGFPTGDSLNEKLDGEAEGGPGVSPIATNTMVRPPSTAESLPERFFVLKSLTLQDLEVSTRTGVWATQVHNEETLNRAYQAAENVYLFFSANKSGEYFGYARMASKIGAPGVSFEPKSASSSAGSAQGAIIALEAPPKAIFTSETEWAPRGRIIDDTARGTIFWEADIEGENDKGEGGEESEATPVLPSISPTTPQEPAIASSTTVSSPTSRRGSTLELAEADEGPATSPGKAFRIEWLSVKKLPFYKCRGLRNPWNANREVKIARDGTELETNVGKKLMMFFGSPSPGYATR